MKTGKQIWNITKRECGILKSNPIYLFCMVIFPIIVIIFFTSIMSEGLPENLPIGVVDNDNTSTSRALIRQLDAFQSSEVVAHYPNIHDARTDAQQNKIYAFLLIPKGTENALISSRQPTISFYYNYAYIAAGSLVFRDLKTISMLGSAAVGKAKLSALGKTEQEIRAFLQPITLDVHPLNNPEINYNVYLSSSLIPACILLFIFLITAYSIGTELKFNRSKEWLALADNKIGVALIGKLLPQTLIFLTIMCAYEFYVCYILHFPHFGGAWSLLALNILTVLAAQGFGAFAFGLAPSLRMSMSICSLWAALSFSIMGATFPVNAMDSEIQTLANLFPMRHYFRIYQTCIFNGFSISYVWMNIGALILFTLLPLITLKRIRKAMLEYVYIP